METGDDKQLEWKGHTWLHPGSPSSLDSGSDYTCHRQGKDGAEKSGMSINEEQGPFSDFPLLYEKPDEPHMLHPVIPLIILMEMGVGQGREGVSMSTQLHHGVTCKILSPHSILDFVNGPDEW